MSSKMPVQARKRRQKRTPDWGPHVEGPPEGTVCTSLACENVASKVDRKAEKKSRLHKWVYKESGGHTWWFCCPHHRNCHSLMDKALESAHDELAKKKESDAKCDVCKKDTFKEIAYAFGDKFFCTPMCMLTAVEHGREDLFEHAMETFTRAKDEGKFDPEVLNRMSADAVPAPSPCESDPACPPSPHPPEDE